MSRLAKWFLKNQTYMLQIFYLNLYYSFFMEIGHQNKYKNILFIWSKYAMGSSKKHQYNFTLCIFTWQTNYVGQWPVSRLEPVYVCFIFTFYYLSFSSFHKIKKFLSQSNAILYAGWTGVFVFFELSIIFLHSRTGYVSA